MTVGLGFSEGLVQDILVLPSPQQLGHFVHDVGDHQQAGIGFSAIYHSLEGFLEFRPFGFGGFSVHHVHLSHGDFPLGEVEFLHIPMADFFRAHGVDGGTGLEHFQDQRFQRS